MWTRKELLESKSKWMSGLYIASLLSVKQMAGHMRVRRFMCLHETFLWGENYLPHRSMWMDVGWIWMSQLAVTNQCGLQQSLMGQRLLKTEGWIGDSWGLKMVPRLEFAHPWNRRYLGKHSRKCSRRKNSITCFEHALAKYLKLLVSSLQNFWSYF